VCDGKKPPRHMPGVMLSSSERSMHHPDHDRLIHEVPRWYRVSSPEMGYHTEERKMGFYSRNAKASHGKTGRVTVKDITSAHVEEFIFDLQQYYGIGTVQVYVDDREVNTQVHGALIDLGCVEENAQSYLAHVGSVAEVPPVPGLKIEPMDSGNLSEYARVKLMGFADSEAEPNTTVLASETSLRRAEMEGSGEFLLARVGNEGAGIVGLYVKRDRLIFQLATRTPFRRKGIGKHLITSVLLDAYRQGNCAVIINADPTDTPIEMYRQLGFTDEVYWRQGYRYQPYRA